ncbi:MAG: cobyrinic acid a,c-diamide synthase [Hyphomicrobiales bacterium]|nr:MAG: cobyrinic acid a,c-diamide synthase [Hyphomicrobiales bacterium]
MAHTRGLLLAAPSSGSGKTFITLALLRALKNKGFSVVGAKSGPDYIDPRFHQAATKVPTINLDGFAMSRDTICHLAAQASNNTELLLVEGAMGLFDGATNNTGSSAELAETLGIPVVLVVDCKGVGQSIAALVGGFVGYGKPNQIKGLILNNVGSERHEKILGDALVPLNIPILGNIRHATALELPARHLGLVQAEEHGALDDFLENAATHINKYINFNALVDVASTLNAPENPSNTLQPLGQHVAIARDAAFAFCYPHQLQEWQNFGAKLSFFSPLNDEGPDKTADAVFLPGGYPELHAGRIAAAENFRDLMSAAKDRKALIYGECGGYMVLGDGLICDQQKTHKMLGFLPVTTSFAIRKLHLGYRNLVPSAHAPWAQNLKGHEFHYASTIELGQGESLFQASDALGQNLGPMGLIKGRVMGSFAHLI